MKKVQSVLKSFYITPKGDSGDFTVKLNFEAHEGPGMLQELLDDIGPLLKKECLIRIEPIQLSIINTKTGEVTNAKK